MAQDFSIWIVSPEGYIHSRCFEETALALREAFAELGHDAPIVTNPKAARGQTIALGANLMPRVKAAPANCILYNLEQIGEDCSWLTPAYIELLSSHRVWDYSRKNIEALAQYGIAADLCELGYTPGLTRIAAAEHRDIDVAFVGSMNERRRSLLKALHERGKIVFAAFNLYGAERDAIYARAKIAINIHYFESKVFEIVRVSYLLANRMCVVSETGADGDVEAIYKDGVAFSPYEDLVDTCVRLIDDDTARRSIAEAGFAAFSARSQARFLKAALVASGLA